MLDSSKIEVTCARIRTGDFSRSLSVSQLFLLVWEVAAGNASWEIAVPLVKRLKRAAARYTSIRRYADRLHVVSYAYAYECPPTRVRNTLPTRRSSRAHTWASLRRHWLDELSTTDWAHQNWARHDWAQHDTVWPTDTFDCVDNWYDWTETVLLYELGVYHGNLFSLFQKWNVHLQVAFSWLYRCRSEWLKTRFNVLFVLNFSH